VSAPASHLSSFTLDALALGALGAAEEAQAKQHLSTCATCGRALEAAQAARQEFHGSVLPRTLARVQERAGRSRWRNVFGPWMLLPVSALAATAVLLLVLRGGAPAGRVELPGAGADLATKGSATLRVFASHEGRVFQVHDGSLLAPGDQIRFVVEPGDLPYLLIASVDGTGKPSVYYPFDARASGRLDPAITLELPGSIVLDAAPGPERIFALFSRQPVDAELVRTSLAELGKLGPAGIRTRRTLRAPAQTQVSLFFEKVVP